MKKPHMVKKCAGGGIDRRLGALGDLGPDARCRVVGYGSCPDDQRKATRLCAGDAHHAVMLMPSISLIGVLRGHGKSPNS